jgi:spore maturation protein CgeB
VHFVEKDVEWYRDNRDLPKPEFCTVQLYKEWQESARALVDAGKDADAIVIGSYFPDAKSLSRELLESSSAPLLFYDIDTPITIAQLRATGETDYIDSSMIPQFAAYLSFSGGPTLKELERDFGSPSAVPFYCSVDPDLYRPTPCRNEYRCDLSYLGTYAADRQAKLMQLLCGAAKLLPERRFIVAGSKYPNGIAWGTQVDRMIHISPPEHPAFYCSSRFTLNLTRKDMVAAGYSPSVRLFEASACGAAIMSDPWCGLDEFLAPGDEVLLPTDEYEVVSILSGMSDQERIRMGQRARERILAEHTSDHRAKELEQVIAQVS